MQRLAATEADRQCGIPIMSAVNSLVPAGRTPLTQGIETAAEASDFRSKPGVVVVLTDGEETW
jgi:Ca-activated chloride channel family protein